MTVYSTCKIGEGIPNPDTRTQDEINEGRMQNFELDVHMHTVKASKTTEQLQSECVDYEYLAIRLALGTDTATDEQCRQLARDYVHASIEKQFNDLWEDRRSDLDPEEFGDELQFFDENLHREIVKRWLYVIEGTMHGNSEAVCIGSQANCWKNFLEWRITMGLDPIDIPNYNRTDEDPEIRYRLPDNLQRTG